MSNECELCGKTQEEAESIEKHQGLDKCHMCILEYKNGQKETTESNQEDRTVQNKEEGRETNDWLEQASADQTY